MNSSPGATDKTLLAQVGRLQTAEIIGKIPGISSAGTAWVARCLAHDDSTPNLSIRDSDDGELLIGCDAVCERQRVIAVLSHEHDHSSPWFGRSTCRSIIDAVTPSTPKQLSSFGNL